VKEKLRML